MNAYAIQHQVTINVETCCSCGVPFGITAELQRKFRSNGGLFYCTNGHSQHYTTTEVQKLRDELAGEKTRHKATLARANESERERDSLKLRASKGVCPCCNRQFQNMARHMKTKHPTFKCGAAA